MIILSNIVYIMLNKERHKKEIVRVGKPPETLRFKNSIVRKMNNSGYEAIRSIVETNDQAVQQPQITTQPLKTDKNLIAHKKYNNGNNNNKKSK